MGCGSSKVNTFSAPSDRSSSSRNPTTARPSMKTLSIATEPLVFVTTAANAVDTNEIRIAGPNRNDAMRNNRIAPLQTETKEQDIDRKEIEKREIDKKELEKKEIDSPEDEKQKQLQGQIKKESHDTHESGLLHRDLKNILNPNNMIAAIKRGDLDSVKQLVESHEHGNENENRNENLAINCLGMWNSSPLMIAIQYGKIEIVNYLLDHKGIKVNHANDNRVTALLLACSDGYNSIVLRLLDMGVNTSPGVAKAFYNPHIDKAILATPFSVAVMNNHHTTVEIFLKNNHNVNTIFKFSIPVGDKFTENFSPILLASLYGSVNVIKMLLLYKADVCVVDSTYSNILHYAIKSGKQAISVIETLRELVDIKILNKLVNDFDYLGYTPLHYACTLNKIDMVTILLSLGCHVNMRTNNKLYLSYIEKDKDKDKSKIKDKNKELNSNNNDNDETITDEENSEKNDENNEKNENGESNKNEKSKKNTEIIPVWGVTALHIAVKKKSEKIVKILLDSGSDVNLKDEKNISSLDIGMGYRSDSPVLLLLKNKAGIIGKSEKDIDNFIEKKTSKNNNNNSVKKNDNENKNSKGNDNGDNIHDKNSNSNNNGNDSSIDNCEIIDISQENFSDNSHHENGKNSIISSTKNSKRNITENSVIHDRNADDKSEEKSVEKNEEKNKEKNEENKISNTDAEDIIANYMNSKKCYRMRNGTDENGKKIEDFKAIEYFEIGENGKYDDKIENGKNENSDKNVENSKNDDNNEIRTAAMADTKIILTENGKKNADMNTRSLQKTRERQEFKEYHNKIEKEKQNSDDKFLEYAGNGNQNREKTIIEDGNGNGNESKNGNENKNGNKIKNGNGYFNGRKIIINGNRKRSGELDEAVINLVQRAVGNVMSEHEQEHELN